MKTALIAVCICMINSGKFSEFPCTPHVEYYPNGQIKSTGTYQNGSMIGTWTTFYPDGKIESIRHYSGLFDDQFTYSIGSALQYYPNGQLKCRTDYFDPDHPEKNFNFVDQYPGVASGYDIELKNGSFYTGASWDSTGKPIVTTGTVLIQNDQYSFPIRYNYNGKIIFDTLKYKMGKDKWLWAE